MKNERQTQISLTIRQEQINQKILAKEGRLKRYWHRVKLYRKNRFFQNNKRKFFQCVDGDFSKTKLQPEEKETKQFPNKMSRKNILNANKNQAYPNGPQKVKH